MFDVRIYVMSTFSLSDQGPFFSTAVAVVAGAAPLSDMVAIGLCVRSVSVYIHDNMSEVSWLARGRWEIRLTCSWFGVTVK